MVWTFKLGVFDSIIGLRSVESRITRIIHGLTEHSIEPADAYGFAGQYRFSDLVSASVGVADTVNSSINLARTVWVHRGVKRVI